MILTLETKKVQIQGVKWTGDNFIEIANFVDDASSIDLLDNDLDVWNQLEMQWINCPLEHWVLKGLKGEFYPCEEEVLFAKYRIV